jgi:transcriptional regulator GlxA family with amidase domain
MSFAAMSGFEAANSALCERRYDVHFLSEQGRPVRTSFGLMVETEPFDESFFDTLIVGGSNEPSFKPSEGLLAFLRKAPEMSRRVAATCVGAFTLAEAGLLDGKRVTTHWDYARELQRRYPKVKVQEDRIFVIDGSVWTSAGMTATLDLVLAMVERDTDPELARTIAKTMVIHHRRSGGQSQFSALLQLEPKSDRIQTALAFARQNLHTGLTVETLAEEAHLSPRQFTRAFAAETGDSPAKAIEKLRLEAARLLLEDSRHPIETIARQTGFADREERGGHSCAYSACRRRRCDVRFGGTRKWPATSRQARCPRSLMLIWGSPRSPPSCKATCRHSGNFSPNTGNPLCDSALVASSCSTSQCSPKTPSANHGEQFSLSRMAGMRSRSYKVFDNSTIRRGSAAITKSPSLNSEKCVSAFGLTLSGAAQSMHTSLSRSTPSQSRIMGPGRNIVEPRVIQRMGS